MQSPRCYTPARLPTRKGQDPLSRPIDGRLALEALIAGARLAGIELDGRQQEKFCHYHSLLERGAETAGVTAVRGWADVRDELFLRSMRMIRVIRSNRAAPSISRVIDIGTGGGIPGLVLKIALPEIKLTLLDSSLRKTEFLKEAVSELGVDGVEIVRARAETAAHEPGHREQYEFVVARSLARLAELAELTIPFCITGGSVIAVKQQDVMVEVEEAARAAAEFGAAAAEIAVTTEPGPAAPDAFVIWKKVSSTPRRFPRRVGVPHKRPLLTPSGWSIKS